MTIALSKTDIDQLDQPRKNAVSEIQPDLLLGDPVLYEDENGKQWYCFSDSRWTLFQVAILSCIGLNIDALKGYDSPYVDNETGEVTDRDALHEEAVAMLQDPNVADPTLTLPENVTPSDPEAARPSFEDVRAAQEKNDGDLDDKVLLHVDTSQWTRVEA
jgi:hypothetical protein